MPKRIANGLTLLSAVVCVGSAMLVGRSWFRMDGLAIPTSEEGCVVFASCDAQLVVWNVPLPQPPGFSTAPVGIFRYTLEGIWGRLAGVRWLGVGAGAIGAQTFVILPLWLLPLLTAIPPVRWRRARCREGGRGFAVETRVGNGA